MKHKALKALSLLAAAALVLTGCSGSKETFEEAGSLPTATPISQTQFTAANANQESTGLMDQNPYEGEWSADGTETIATETIAEEAMEEEDFTEPSDTSFYEAEATAMVAAQVTAYPYAGATPILLDPIDKPTPTPKAQFTLTYVDYAISSLGLNCKLPAGWIVDQSQNQVCTISEPEGDVRDGQRCIITISAEPVASKYSEKDLTSLVKQRLSTIKEEGYSFFDSSLTATRKMMGTTGVYLNYNATRTDGVEVGGRIMYACLDKTLYGLEIVYPYGYKSSYEPAFGEVRGSLAVIK